MAGLVERVVRGWEGGGCHGRHALWCDGGPPVVVVVGAKGIGL